MANFLLSYTVSPFPYVNIGEEKSAYLPIFWLIVSVTSFLCHIPARRPCFPTLAQQPFTKQEPHEAHKHYHYLPFLDAFLHLRTTLLCLLYYESLATLSSSKRKDLDLVAAAVVRSRVAHYSYHYDVKSKYYPLPSIALTSTPFLDTGDKIRGWQLGEIVLGQVLLKLRSCECSVIVRTEE